MTEKVLRKHGEMLKFLERANPSVVKAALKTASPDLINTVCECSHNIMRLNVRLSPSQKRRLGRYKASLRALTQKTLSCKRRKHILQTGGFIGALLGPIISVFKNLLNI